MTSQVQIPPAPPGTLRMMTWNLLNGGVDEGSHHRLLAQLELIARYAPDVLCLPEATHWAEDENKLLGLATQTLGMRHITLARSREGDGRNCTTVLYNSAALQVVDYTLRGKQTFHHAAIRARMRPRANGDSPRGDFLVLGTHLSPYDGDTRLAEARWLTDYGGAFPGMPGRAVLLGDLNVPDRAPESWDAVPINLHSRYRLVQPDGSFGGADQRALRVLLQSGWQDPHAMLGVVERPPTVGHFYPNEPTEWALDYVLLSGLRPVQTFTHPLDKAFCESDHVPHCVDVAMAA